MKVVFRERFVERYCRGKTVLDLGSVSSETYRQEMRHDRWLFARIDRQAAKAVGVDILAGPIAELRQEGYDIRYHDIEQLHSFVAEESYNLIVAGEVIEHLTNMHAFLTGVRQQMSNRTELLITTPNPFGFIRFLDAVRRRERCRPDHVAWYSGQTLSHLLARHGLKVRSQLFYCFLSRFKRSVPLSYLRRGVSMLFPFLADGLIVIAVRDDAPDLPA